MNILYTIVPIEVVFGEEERTDGREELAVRAGSGRILMIRGDGFGGASITRLLSTDPRDYLDRRWQPGRPWRLS